jgi:hypothetical protein
MYAKIFSQILDSSIVENPEVRFTFMDLLVLCDKDGVVDMTHEAIARRTNRPLDVIRSTIKALEEPDPRSRTPTHDGSRIVRLDDHRDWGWLIINYTKFSQIRTAEERRAYKKEWMAKKRAEKSCGQSVDSCGQTRTMLTNADVDADVDVIQNTYIARVREDEVASSQTSVPTLKDCLDYGVVIGFKPEDATRFFNHFQSVGWKTSGGVRITDWRFKMKNWKVENEQKRHLGASKHGNKPAVVMPTYSDDDPLFRKRD